MQQQFKKGVENEKNDCYKLNYFIFTFFLW